MLKTQKKTFPISLENFSRYISYKDVADYDRQVFKMDSSEGIKEFFERHPQLKDAIKFERLGALKVRLEVKW